MKKKIITIVLISFVSFGSFMTGFNINVPYAYAIDQEDIQGWTQAKNTSDLVEAFRYYCKSRNLIIDGSIADAVTSVTTTYFNTICNGLGIDVTALQAEIYSKTYTNTGLQFLFTQSGIATYNRIFAEFLQNNDLEVGDTDVNKTLYNGSVFTDSDGRTCLIYEIKAGYSFGSSVDYSDVIVTEGSYYRFSAAEVENMPFAFPSSTKSDVYYINSIDYAFSFRDFREETIPTYRYMYVGNSTRSPIINTMNRSNQYNSVGYLIVYRRLDNNHICFGVYRHIFSSDKYYVSFIYDFTSNNQETDVQDTNVTVNSPIINNNNYVNNTYTVINNNGDTYNVTNYPDDDPSSPGGGGGDDDTEPPYDIPDNPTYDTPDGWGIELPDDITTNNWLLYGLEKKFPWDIPFNMIFALSLLNAEPETPHFTGAIDLKVCTWNYDIDLEPFDTIAGYCREFFFLGFIIGLMLLTRQLIWG